MHLNIDDIIARCDRQSLELTIAGKTYAVTPASAEQLEALNNAGKTSSSSTAIKESMSPVLRELLGCSDPDHWTFMQVTGAAAAIVTYEGRASAAHIREIVATVRASGGTHSQE